MAYKCVFTGIPALPVDSRFYTNAMSEQLVSATAGIIASGGTILSGSLSFLYMNNAIFAIIPYII